MEEDDDGYMTEDFEEGGFEDVNDEPRFGENVNHSLADTEHSFDSAYVLGAALYRDHVFHCVRRADGVPHVVKVFRRPVGPAGHPGAMEQRERVRTARELDVMRALTPRPDLFVELRGVFITAGRVSVVTREYAEDLHALYERRWVPGFSDAEVRTVAARLLTALAYLHDVLGVVHRDVKPLNVFLAVAGDVSTAVLGDVGHSRSLATGELASTTGCTLGTSPFRPPEFVFTMQPHGRPVDLFQLGVSLYLLVVGCGPHRVADVAAVFARHAYFSRAASAAWDAAAAAGGAAGAARAACVRRMMAMDPADRGTAAENLSDPWVAGAVA